MKRHILFSMICLLLFAFCVNTAFADYLGPNPDLRTYTEYTIEQISIPGTYVQCVDDTASPARTLGQFCDISDSPVPIDIIITASLFVFMTAMRLFFPDSRDAYQTPLGTFFLILSIVTACVGYIVGNKVLNSAGKVLEIGGE